VDLSRHSDFCFDLRLSEQRHGLWRGTKGIHVRPFRFRVTAWKFTPSLPSPQPAAVALPLVPPSAHSFTCLTLSMNAWGPQQASPTIEQRLHSMVDFENEPQHHVVEFDPVNPDKCNVSQHCGLPPRHCHSGRAYWGIGCGSALPAGSTGEVICAFHANQRRTATPQHGKAKEILRRLRTTFCRVPADRFGGAVLMMA